MFRSFEYCLYVYIYLTVLLWVHLQLMFYLKLDYYNFDWRFYLCASTEWITLQHWTKDAFIHDFSGTLHETTIAVPASLPSMPKSVMLHSAGPNNNILLTPGSHVKKAHFFPQDLWHRWHVKNEHVDYKRIDGYRSTWGMLGPSVMGPDHLQTCCLLHVCDHDP